MQPPPYAMGDRVRVTDGPLAGFDAEVRVVLTDRLQLAVAVRGMTVPIETEAWQVERVT